MHSTACYRGYRRGFHRGSARLVLLTWNTSETSVSHCVGAKYTLSDSVYPVAIDEEYAFGQTTMNSPGLWTTRESGTRAACSRCGGIMVMSEGNQMDLFWQEVGQSVSTALRNSALNSSGMPYLEKFLG